MTPLTSSSPISCVELCKDSAQPPGGSVRACQDTFCPRTRQRRVATGTSSPEWNRITAGGVGTAPSPHVLTPPATAAVDKTHPPRFQLQPAPALGAPRPKTRMVTGHFTGEYTAAEGAGRDHPSTGTPLWANKRQTWEPRP